MRSHSRFVAGFGFAALLTLGAIDRAGAAIVPVSRDYHVTASAGALTDSPPDAHYTTQPDALSEMAAADDGNTRTTSTVFASYVDIGNAVVSFSGGTGVGGPAPTTGHGDASFDVVFDVTQAVFLREDLSLFGQGGNGSWSITSASHGTIFSGLSNTSRTKLFPVDRYTAHFSGFSTYPSLTSRSISFSSTLTVVPEPASIAVLALAAIPMLVGRRRSR